MAPMTAVVFDGLRTVRECIAVTIRREVAGRMWDITLNYEEYALSNNSAPLVAYSWEAEEPLLLRDDLPLRPQFARARDLVEGIRGFETPEEALADALTVLEQGKGDAYIFVAQRNDVAPWEDAPAEGASRAR